MDAGPEEALHLVMHTADRLTPPKLIDRAGDREILAHGHAGEIRKHRQQFRQRSAVAVNAAVALLERDRAVEGQRVAAREIDGEQRSEEHTSELQSLMRISY